MNSNNDYFIFYDNTLGDSEVNRQFDYILKTKQEWESLGFDLNLNELGKPQNDRKYTFRFQDVRYKLQEKDPVC